MRSHDRIRSVCPPLVCKTAGIIHTTLKVIYSFLDAVLGVFFVCPFFFYNADWRLGDS